MVHTGGPHQPDGCTAQQGTSSPAALSQSLDTQPQQMRASQDIGARSSQQLMQSALAALLPAQLAPRSRTGTTAAGACSMLASGAAAFAAPSSMQIPALSNLSDPRELQLVAAAFAAGAAAGVAASQLDSTLPLLDEQGSGDISHSGATADTAAVTAAPGQPDLSHESAETTATDCKQKTGTVKRRAGTGGACKSSYRGVFWDRKNHRWRAQVGHNNRKIFMGYFSEPSEAARAYDKKLVQLRGTMAKTNFPLQDYADDLQLHKELRARENGDELLLLPLEELQAHLQQHLQELLPKQPGLQKVYNDWSRNKAQAEAQAHASHVSHDTQQAPNNTQQAAASLQLLQQGMLSPQMLLQLQHVLRNGASGSQQVSLEGGASHQGSARPSSITGLAQAQAQTQTQACVDAASADQLPPHSSSQLPVVLEQQWSTTLPSDQQQQQQLRQLQQQPGSQVVSIKVDPLLLASPHVTQKTKGGAAQHQQAHCKQQQRVQQHSRLSSPVPAHSSGHAADGSPTSWSPAAAGSSASGGSSSSGGGCAGGNRPHQRDASRSLQQHLLTRLHKQRCSSGSSMDALLAAAAVLEEEEEVALTLCEQLHQLVPSTPPPQQQQQQPLSSTPGQNAALGSTAAPAVKQDAGCAGGVKQQEPGAAVQVAPADGGEQAGAAAAATAAAAANGSRVVHGGARISSGKSDVVVTDTAAVIAAILGLSTAQQQQHQQQCTAKMPEQQQQRDSTNVTPPQAQELLLDVAAAGAVSSAAAAAEQLPTSNKGDQQPGLQQQQQHVAGEAHPCVALPGEGAAQKPADPVNSGRETPLQHEPAQTVRDDPRPSSQQQQQQVQVQEGQCHLKALQQQMSHPPSSEHQVVQTIQLAHRAGLDKESQQLLLLVMYHQVLDLQKQGQQQQLQQQQPLQQLFKQPAQVVQQQESQHGSPAGPPQQQQTGTERQEPQQQQQQQQLDQVLPGKPQQQGVVVTGHVDDKQQRTAGSTAGHGCASTTQEGPRRSVRSAAKALARKREDSSTPQQQSSGTNTGPASTSAAQQNSGRPAKLRRCGLTPSAEAVVGRVGRPPAHSCSITAAPGLLALQAVMSGDVMLLP